MASPSASSDVTRRRAAEWQFFADTGRWKESNYLQATCLSCHEIALSKREQMHLHITKCQSIDKVKNKDYLQSGLAYAVRPHKKQISKTMESFFLRKMTPAQLTKLQDQALRFAISSNIPFPALEDPEFKVLLRLLNPTAALPTGTVLRIRCSVVYALKQTSKLRRCTSKGQMSPSVFMDGRRRRMPSGSAIARSYETAHRV